VNFHFQKRYSVARGTAELLRKQQSEADDSLISSAIPRGGHGVTQKNAPYQEPIFFTLVYKKTLLIIHFSY
jgi:hypothetical protein